MLKKKTAWLLYRLNIPERVFDSLEEALDMDGSFSNVAWKRDSLGTLQLVDLSDGSPSQLRIESIPFLYTEE